MRLQELPTADRDVTASQTRVSSQELADALKALQARQEEAARRLEGTLPIGEALQELNLDASPEEVLAEVQAQRARAGTRKRHGRRKAARLTVCATLLALTGFGLHHLAPTHQASGCWTGYYLVGPPVSVNCILNGDGTGSMVSSYGLTGDTLKWTEAGHIVHITIDAPAGTFPATGVISDDDKQLNLSLASDLVDPGWHGGAVCVVLSKK